jgi:hypothetical protein
VAIWLCLQTYVPKSPGVTNHSGAMPIRPQATISGTTLVCTFGESDLGVVIAFVMSTT